MISSAIIEPVRPAHAARAAGGPLRPASPAAVFPETVGTGLTGRRVNLWQPPAILFGDGCAAECGQRFAGRGLRHLLVVTSPTVVKSCAGVIAAWQAAGLRTTIFSGIDTEPTVRRFTECLAVARREPVDGVVGLGGGSPMDVAKLVAALADSSQSVTDVFGINRLHGRKLFLACLPTTAGTGSEVSPNAILLDETSRSKQGIISPHLVPDFACVDPVLTHSVPPAVTAATGLDALTHCIEAYANRFAHPAVDVHALAGIRLIANHLLPAIANGRDAEARANLSLGSLYGGLCLGPVNTAAVHALAYPLGGEFHVAHGISNAVLLPHVLRFNLPAAPQRYADVAVALGAAAGDSPLATAERGVARLVELMARCPLPRRISELGVPATALPRLVQLAMTVTRLLKNNPRELTVADARGIYEAAW